MESIVCDPKRMVVIRLDKGDDLMVSLKEAARKHGVKCGSFSMIGGLKEAVYGLYNDKEHKVVKKTAKNCFEILSAVGNITIKEGDILIHSHISATDDNDGSVFGGHLMEGSIVSPFAEIFIQELDAEVGRRFDKGLNLWPMAFK